MIKGSRKPNSKCSVCNFRLTKQDYEMLSSLAEESGKSISMYLRDLMYKDYIKKQEEETTKCKQA